MRIGILTFHRAHNYGALLQAYALKTYLEAQGHDVSFVDYMPKWHADEYRVWNSTTFKKESFIDKIKYIIVWMLTFRRKTKRYNNFQRFITQYMHLSPKAQYVQSPIQLEDKYDYIVVGSDQIWRNWIVSDKYIGFDPIYYGENITPKSKYIAYAASMGIIDYNAKEKIFLQRMLSNFEEIAVREKTLQDELQMLGCESTLVADPTFLLTKEQWNAILPQKRYTKEKYVLFYHLLGSENAHLLAERVAHKLGCKLLTIRASVPLTPRKNEIQTAGPVEFLHMLRDAEFVVATSFHGTAFSVIFEKSFYTLGLGKNADRVLTLLQQLGLQDRYIENAVDVITALDFEKIDLKSFVNTSKKYLKAINDYKL